MGRRTMGAIVTYTLTSKHLYTFKNKKYTIFHGDEVVAGEQDGSLQLRQPGV